MRAAVLSLLTVGLVSGAPRPAGADPDVAGARVLYQAAEGEIAAGQYADAARDYGAAYELTKDPVLFWKLGSANEKAGQCAVAIVYFRRYLKEAAPAESFVALTRARIEACGGTVDEPARSPVAPPPPLVAPPPPLAVIAPPPPAPPPPVKLGSHAAAWLVGGAAVALAIGGIVLAESAHSSEADVSDLYVGLQNTPPTYDAATQKKYQDLLDEGHRYEHLSWTAFGLTAAALGVSAYLFTRPSEGEPVIAPTASAHGAGAAAQWRF